MEASPVHRHAACSCGQLSLVTRGEPFRISVCHCLACQRRTGSTFGVQARFPATDVRIKGSSTEYVRTASSGNQVIFHFCPHCAATVYYQLVDTPDVIAVPVGVFADPGFPPPGVSVYESKQHAWTGLPEDMEHHD
jgi:hypothetical protein